MAQMLSSNLILLMSVQSSTLSVQFFSRADAARSQVE